MTAETSKRARRAAYIIICLLLVCQLLVSASAESGVGLLRHLEVDGQDYIARTDITTVLLMGVDQRTFDRERAMLHHGGQADFIMLLVVDHGARQIHQLQIDRDCMTEITTIGILGNRSGSRVTQLCLAHGFGDGFEISCELTAEAVSKLLLGTEIDMYASLALNGIGVINEVLGGVTVTLPEDYTVHDPAMVKGATLTLNDQQAEYMVRSRMEIGDGSNASRMQRQQVFIKAATAQFKSKLSENINFADTMLDALEEVMVTNFKRGRIINELNRAYKYDILPVETLAGEYTIGADGFREFYADAEALRQWVLETVYTPNN